MFGILKAGVKLGIGCFVTIILFVALVAGAIWWYCSDSKPAPRNRNRNGRRAVLLKPPPHAASPLERYAVTEAGFLALGQQEAQYVPRAERIAEGRVDLYAVEDDKTAQPLGEIDV